MTSPQVPMSRTVRQATARTRALLGERERMVVEGNELMRRCWEHLDHHRQLTDFHDSDIQRPKWLSSWLNWTIKAALVLAEVSVGAGALIVAGDPPTTAYLTFTGVGLSTVGAGTLIGTQFRRGEQASSRAMVALAVLAVAVATAVLSIVRFATLEITVAVGLFTVVVAIGSAVFAYLWEDPVADRLSRLGDHHRRLRRRAERCYRHRSVRSFDLAHGELRAAVAEGLQAARRARAVPRLGSPSPASASGNGGHGNRNGHRDDGHRDGDGHPDGSTADPTVDEVLRNLVGDPILHLTPMAPSGPTRPAGS